MAARARCRSLVAGRRKMAAVSATVAITDVAELIALRVIATSAAFGPSRNRAYDPPVGGTPEKPSLPPIERVQGPDIKGCARRRGPIKTRSGTAVNENMTIRLREQSLEDQWLGMIPNCALADAAGHRAKARTGCRLVM